MNLKRVKEILESKSLDEKEIKALDEFFTQYTEEVKIAERKKLGINGNEEMIPKSLAEKAFNKFNKDAETAFNLFKEDSKNAFNLFKSDSEKAFDLYAEDLQNEYAENMVKGLQDLYSDIETRVKKDFMESKDASILNGIKRLVMPLVAAEEQQALLEEIDKLKSEKKIILEETQEVTKENIINSLVSGFPKEYAEDIKSYLVPSKNEDEIYERFSFICEMVDKGAIKPKTVISEEVKKVEDKKVAKKVEKKQITEEKRPAIKQKKLITEELNSSSSVRSKSKEVTTAPKKFFTDEDDAIISMLFGA